MKQCEMCGIEIIGLPYKCKYCNEIYCLEHRLPENHMCLFTSSKGLVPQKLEGNGTYFHDSTDLKRPQKLKKVKHKKKKKKRKSRMI